MMMKGKKKRKNTWEKRKNKYSTRGRITLGDNLRREFSAQQKENQKGNGPHRFLIAIRLCKGYRLGKKKREIRDDAGIIKSRGG